MRFNPTYGNIWRISYPLVIAGISETIVEITDTAFLSRYHVAALAAVGLADAIYTMALFLSLGLVDGVQIMVGRRVGEQRAAEVGRVFNQGLYLLAIVSAVMIAAIKWSVPRLPVDMFGSADVQAAADAYLQISAYALFFHACNLAFSAFYVGIARTRILIGATVTLAVTNIALDYCLIFGNLGFPALGMRGAALASLSAEAAVFGFLVLDVARKRYIARYGLLRFGRWDGALARRLAVISAPVSIETLIETVRWLVFFVIVAQLGEEVLGAANIVFSCYALLLIPLDGISETTCSMVSNLLGQRRPKVLGVFLSRAITLTYLTVAPLLVAALAFPDHVLAIFTSEPQMAGTALGGLLVVALVTLIAVPGEMFFSAVAGTGDTKAIMTIQLILTGCALGYAYFAAIVRELPLGYIWLSEAVGWSACLLLSWLWFRSGRWRRLTI